MNDTERLLGDRLALDGGDEVEYYFRLDQVKALSDKVASFPFLRYDVEVIYRERQISSISYYLPITQFTDNQCDNILQAGYNCTLPTFPRHLSLDHSNF